MVLPFANRPPFSFEVTSAKDTKYIGHWLYVDYVAEGAANVVFKTHLPPYAGKPDPRDKTDEDLLNKLLLRVPKAPKDPNKPYLNAGLQLGYLQQFILPIFDYRRDLVVVHRLGKGNKDIIMNMVNHLKALDNIPPPRRPAKFRGDTIEPGEECFVALVEDMRPRPGERAVEFKPKWLAQSPSAPPKANTCRCCALASKKYYDANNPQTANNPNHKAEGDEKTSNDKGKAKAKIDSPIKEQRLSPDNYPCPLWLDPERVTPPGKKSIRAAAIKKIFKDDENYARLYELLKQKPTLKLLKQHQLSKDPLGPLRRAKDIADVDYGIAMTLRDCSLFVRYLDDASFEAKLADLDWKNIDWKFDEWRAKELALVEEEWYTGRGQMRNCALWN
ncbi:inositol-pentakisphosphate 2-kinase [Colletotrichum gloeosporioides Cg-14]|uniref:Inositol-pentakisphosphate 2-kinase n=1 Tax=Colletotrichum gloeosporioides (strain Cg-14) TaxID=1237896 RepID=T0LZ10_COLGC|nr:inositol-pentakisphosphate 2-kinase [Colletotrichum gloeosporioides Cg-14]